MPDCSLLSALSALAEFPDRVRSLFKTDQYNSQRLWCVSLFKNGKPKLVFMDDYIPCLGNVHGQPSPCFSSAVGNELWVIMVEKAFAKLHGTY